MIQDAAKSNVPAIGYGMPYAIGNTLLTIFGMAVVILRQIRARQAEIDGRRTMDAVTLRQYETLSPFEIKNDLAKIATKTAHAAQVAYLNAGRGNPNWIATEPRPRSSCSASSRSPRVSARWRTRRHRWHA